MTHVFDFRTHLVNLKSTGAIEPESD